MGFQSFRLRKQVEVVVVAPVIYAPLLLDLPFKFVNYLLLLIDSVKELGVVVADVSSLFLDYEPLVFNLVDLCVLVL